MPKQNCSRKWKTYLADEFFDSVFFKLFFHLNSDRTLLGTVSSGISKQGYAHNLLHLRGRIHDLTREWNIEQWKIYGLSPGIWLTQAQAIRFENTSFKHGWFHGLGHSTSILSPYGLDFRQNDHFRFIDHNQHRLALFELILITGVWFNALLFDFLFLAHNDQVFIFLHQGVIPYLVIELMASLWWCLTEEISAYLGLKSFSVMHYVVWCQWIAYFIVGLPLWQSTVQWHTFFLTHTWLKCFFLSFLIVATLKLHKLSTVICYNQTSQNASV